MRRGLLSLVAVLIFAFAANAQYWTGIQTGGAASRGSSYMTAVDKDVLWMLNYDGSDTGNHIAEFTKTTDGGATWTTKTIMEGAISTGSLCALDANNAWICLYNNSSKKTGIYKTTDGGETWARQESAFNEGTSFANNVHFWDTNNGFAQGDVLPNGEFEVYTTTDGGTTWNVVAGDKLPDPIAGETGGYTYCYDATDDLIAFGTNKGRLYYSKDKGATWEVTNPSAISDLNILELHDANNWIVGESSGEQPNTVYTYMITADGGQTWEDLYGEPEESMLGSGLDAVKSSKEGYDKMYVSCGSHGTFASVTFSLDYGANWTPYYSESTPEPVFTYDGYIRSALEVEFLDAGFGWASCFVGEDSGNFGVLKYKNADLEETGPGATEDVKSFDVTYQVTENAINLNNTKNIKKVVISNLAGQQVKTTGKVSTIEISNLNTGIYIITFVQKDGQVKTYKFFKK